MTEYLKLICVEKFAHTVEIEEIQTGKKGVASSAPDGVAVFYGAIDGSDDKVLTPRDFNRNFRITTIIMA